MHWFVKVVDAMSNLGGILAAIFVFALTLPVFINVITRRLLNHPIALVDEVSGYLLVGIVFIALAYTMQHGGHVSITVVVDRLPDKVRRKLQIIVPILAFGWFVPLIYGTSVFWHSIYEQGMISLKPSGVSVWIPNIVVPVGVALLMLQVIAQLIKERKSGKP